MIRLTSLEMNQAASDMYARTHMYYAHISRAARYSSIRMCISAMAEYSSMLKKKFLDIIPRNTSQCTKLLRSK